MKDWGDEEGDLTLYYVPKLVNDVAPAGCTIFDADLIVHSDGTVTACCWDYNLHVSGDGFDNIQRRTAARPVARAGSDAFA